MKLSKERKIFIGLLVVALGVVFVDRVIIGTDVTEPKPAKAKSAEQPSNPKPAAASAEHSAPIPMRGPAISDRLSKAVQAHGASPSADMRDAFAPSGAWAAELGSGQGDIGPKPFHERHRLVAVVVVEGERYVIIDDQTLGVGNTLDGYTLVDVSERTAVLESNGHRVELEIQSD